eukprot:gene17254-20563_t
MADEQTHLEIAAKRSSELEILNGELWTLYGLAHKRRSAQSTASDQVNEQLLSLLDELQQNLSDQAEQIIASNQHQHQQGEEVSEVSSTMNSTVQEVNVTVKALFLNPGNNELSAEMVPAPLMFLIMGIHLLIAFYALFKTIICLYDSYVLNLSSQ